MLDPDIQTLVRMGDITGAIGLYHQRHGGSLLVARNAVEAARKGLAAADEDPPAHVAGGGSATLINDAGIDALLRAGQVLDAVKRYRDLHGVGLQEAKDAIDAMRAGRSVAPPQRPAPALQLPSLGDDELDGALRDGHKIVAIKRYRELYGTGLKEAKDNVEAMLAGEHVQHPPRPGAAAASSGDDGPLADPTFQAALRAGHLIPAIKRYRELMGPAIGLKEAKDAVEAMASELQGPAAPAQPAAPLADEELDAALRDGHKIAAIKRYRELFGVGLKEAKDTVEAMMAGEVVQHPAPLPSAPQPTLQPELDRLIEAGQKIMAVKHYREHTGLGLKESLDAVEARMAELGR